MAEHSISSGYLSAWLREKVARGDVTMRRGLTQMAHSIEVQAEENLSRTSHKYGTKTPARPGGPPSKISGDLGRGVTHTDITKRAGTMEMRVGPASDVLHGNYTSRKKGRARANAGKGKTSSVGAIGEALETGLKNGEKYPFLEPAVDAVAQGYQIAETFVRAWEQSKGSV